MSPVIRAGQAVAGVVGPAGASGGALLGTGADRVPERGLERSSVRAEVLKVALPWCDRYSEDLEREACGFIWEVPVGQGRHVQAWRGMVNVADRPRNRWRIDPVQAAAVVAEIDRNGGRLLAVLHSHPFVEMGVRGWAGPSGEDLVVRERAEQETAVRMGLADLLAAGALGGDGADGASGVARALPESLVWCPGAGEDGILVGYGARGARWAWNRAEYNMLQNPSVEE